MPWMDVLSRYRNAPPFPPNIEDDFDEVAQAVPRQDLGEGLAEAFRSEQTPPFEQMVRQLFEHSDPDQRTGAMNQLNEALGRAYVTPDEARDMRPEQVERIAAQAALNNPNIMERISRFYAEHPQVVRMLGQVALGIAMNRMAARRR